MASSNQTRYLMLNDWAGTDKPTRMDFVRDNQVIDMYLGTHINDADMHLLAAEKARVASPFDVRVLQGTDAAQRTISFDFTPLMVMYFACDEPPVVCDNGVTYVRSCIGVKNTGASGSCLLNGQNFTVDHTTTGNLRYDLNNSSCQYICLAFR